MVRSRIPVCQYKLGKKKTNLNYFAHIYTSKKFMISKSFTWILASHKDNHLVCILSQLGGYHCKGRGEKSINYEVQKIQKDPHLFHLDNYAQAIEMTYSESK